MFSGWRIAATLIAFLTVVAGLSLLAVRLMSTPPSREPHLKRLTGTVAEGLVYRAPKEAFPRASCDACRIARKKLGVFTVGAFCILEFDNLVVNLPDANSQVCRIDKKQNTSESHLGVEALSDALELKALASVSGRQNIPRVAGLSVNGFMLNRMEGESLLPICRAARLKSKGRDIKLYDVTIARGKEEEKVESAILETSPRIVIRWRDGCLDIDNGLENHRPPQD